MDKASLVWHGRLFGLVRFVIAPTLLFVSGFFTVDFLLSGIYTWPRTSRVMALTLTLVVLGYEFIYKEQAAREPDGSLQDRLRTLTYSCVVPYAIGGLALVALARLAA
ncbi:hypothetical protein [Candidatus Nitrospira bockiana]